MKDQAQTTDVLFYPIDFGMLGISCPKCNMETSGVFVGMTTLDLVEQEEVNARETDSLRLHMFMNLISCEEHGVAYPEQS
jgi:hypothetical protein